MNGRHFFASKRDDRGVLLPWRACTKHRELYTTPKRVRLREEEEEAEQIAVDRTKYKNNVDWLIGIVFKLGICLRRPRNTDARTRGACLFNYFNKGIPESFDIRCYAKMFGMVFHFSTSWEKRRWHVAEMSTARHTLPKIVADTRRLRCIYRPEIRRFLVSDTSSTRQWREHLLY